MKGFPLITQEDIHSFLRIGSGHIKRLKDSLLLVSFGCAIQCRQLICSLNTQYRMIFMWGFLLGGSHRTIKTGTLKQSNETND